MRKFQLFVLIMLVASIIATVAPVAAQDSGNPLDGTRYFSPQGRKYDAVWEGWTLSQPDLPEPDMREAHTVEIHVPANTIFVWNSVECFAFDGGHRIVARENGAELFFIEETTVEVRCNGSDMTGFNVTALDVVEAGVPNSTNPMAGLVFVSPQSGDKGEYNAVWGGEKGWWLWQPSLPTTREAHTLEIALWPGLEYRANVEKCVLKRGETVIAQHGNGIKFTAPEVEDVVIYTISCVADPVSGFSIETATELEAYPSWEATDDEWTQLEELLAPEEDAS